MGGVGGERGGTRRKCNDKQVKCVNSCSRGVIHTTYRRDHGYTLHTTQLHLSASSPSFVSTLPLSPPILHITFNSTSHPLPFTSNLYFHFSPSNSCHHTLHLSSLAIHISPPTSQLTPSTFHFLPTNPRTLTSKPFTHVFSAVSSDVKHFTYVAQ